MNVYQSMIGPSGKLVLMNTFPFPGGLLNFFISVLVSNDSCSIILTQYQRSICFSKRF